MELTLNFKNRYCCIIGTWDPPFPEYIELFNCLIEYCRKSNLIPLIVVIYPNPAVFIAESPFPDFFNLNVRVAWIKRLGVDCVAVLNFTKTDLELTAADLTKTLFTELNIKELWAGGTQSFGTGKQGSYDALEESCKYYGVALRKLENPTSIRVKRVALAKDLLADNFQKISSELGYFPTYFIDEYTNLNAIDGEYYGYVTNNPFQVISNQTGTFNISKGKLNLATKLPYPFFLTLTGRVNTLPAK